MSFMKPRYRSQQLNGIGISMTGDGAVVDKVDFFPGFRGDGYVVIGRIGCVFDNMADICYGTKTKAHKSKYRGHSEIEIPRAMPISAARR